MVRYQIKEWDRFFENYKSRERDACGFVCVPNKLGFGMNCILSQHDGAAIYGIWCLLVCVCSRQRKPRLGWLTTDGTGTGTAFTPGDLASLFRRTEAEVVRALDFISSPQVGWIQAHKTDTAVPAEYPSSTQNEGRKEGRNRRKEGKEGKKEVFDAFASSTSEKTQPQSVPDPTPPASPTGSPGSANAGTKATKSARATGMPPSGYHVALREYHAQLWHERYGNAYPFAGGKDGAAVGRILGACKNDLAKAKRLVSDFISDSDPFIAKCGHSLSTLQGQLARYVARLSATTEGSRPATPDEIAEVENIYAQTANWPPTSPETRK